MSSELIEGIMMRTDQRIKINFDCYRWEVIQTGFCTRTWKWNSSGSLKNLLGDYQGSLVIGKHGSNGFKGLQRL